MTDISFRLTTIKATTKEEAIKQAKDNKLGDFIIVKDEKENVFRIGDVDDRKYAEQEKNIIVSAAAKSMGVAEATLSFVDDPDYNGDVDINSFDNMSSNELIQEGNALKTEKFSAKQVEIPTYIQNLIDSPTLSKKGVSISTRDLRDVKTKVGVELFSELKTLYSGSQMPQNLFIGAEFSFGHSKESIHTDYIVPLNVYQNTMNDIKNLYVASEKFKAAADEAIKDGNYNKAAECMKKASLCLKAMDNKLESLMTLGETLTLKPSKFSVPDSSLYVGYHMPINQPYLNKGFFEFGIKIKLPW